MASKRGFILIDNNVIGPWMRNHDFYAQLWERTHKFSGIEKLETAPTAAGFLEFVGTVSPPTPTAIQPSEHLINDLQEVVLNNDPNFADIVERIKVDLYEKYLAWVLQQPCFSVADLTSKYENKVSNLDGQSRKIIDSMFGSCLEGKGIEFLHSRVAISYIPTFDIGSLLEKNEELIKTVDASYFVDIGKVLQESLNLPSIRGIERMWTNFSALLLKNAESGKHKIKIELQQLKDNIALATEYFTFKPDRDYLDMEVIHGACVGKHRSGAIYPVVAVTADPLHCVLYRIALYRSFVRLAFEQFAELGRDLALQPVEGFVFVINKDKPGSPVIDREILVKNIPGLFTKVDTTILLPDRYP